MTVQLAKTKDKTTQLLKLPVFDKIFECTVNKNEGDRLFSSQIEAHGQSTRYRQSALRVSVQLVYALSLV